MGLEGPADLSPATLRFNAKDDHAMTLKTEFETLIGRCRCSYHAEKYTPQAHNRSRTYYFLAEEHLPAEFLCGACRQTKGESLRGGLIVREESKRKGVVVFAAYAAYKLTPQQISSLKKIWPKR